MSKASKGSPRKFAEKIALLNKKEAESTAEFEKILQEVEQTTRAPPHLTNGPIQNRRDQFCPIGRQDESYSSGLQMRSSSFSDGQRYMQLNQYDQLQHTQPIYNSALPHQQQSNQQEAGFIEQPIDDYSIRRQPQQRQPQLVFHNPNHYQMSNNETGTQTIPFSVPNIEISSINDECVQHQQQIHNPIIMSTPPEEQHQNGYISDHYRNICSNPIPISQSRSLPNISNLSVSRNSPCDASGHFMPQATVFVNQRLAPADDNYGNRITARSNESIVDSNGNYFDHQHDHCSLPPTSFRNQQAQNVGPQDLPGLANRTTLVTRSYTDVRQPDLSWQNDIVVMNNIQNTNGDIARSSCNINYGVPISSLPNSATPTPPASNEALPVFKDCGDIY